MRAHQHDAEEPPGAKPRRPVGNEIGATQRHRLVEWA
jgi:hypothetical protein